MGKTEIPNPLYELWKLHAIKNRDEIEAGAMVKEMEARDNAVRRYSWAIPDDRALNMIAQFGPIVEMGAGKGYWAGQLQSRGVDIIAYDAEPPTRFSGNLYCLPGSFFAVKKGLPPVLMRHADRALFLCWPDYNTPFAFDCLSHYKGSTVIYVGESHGGCTGSPAFHDKLEEEFECLGEYANPTWSFIHDGLTIWRRKCASTGSF
jgi:hypothetical protein